MSKVRKKNNQTSVSDADREIPNFGSTDNAGVRHYPFTSGWDSLSASETDERSYLSYPCYQV